MQRPMWSGGRGSGVGAVADLHVSNALNEFGGHSQVRVRAWFTPGQTLFATFALFSLLLTPRHTLPSGAKPCALAPSGRKFLGKWQRFMSHSHTCANVPVPELGG